MSIVIVGAGPAGLTAAYQLSKGGREVTVVEVAGCVGGLARSIELWGQVVDIGPHRFFSKDRRVNELWLEVVGHDYRMVDRETRILYEGKLFQYPLKSSDALRKLGFIEALKCVCSYLQERILPTHQDGSFQSWVSHRFGRRLFQMFFKTYSEKLWGIPCSELDADFAAQRIKQFSLAVAIKTAIFRNGRNNYHTLVDQFAYPIGGSGVVYERMAEAIRKRGGEVCLSSPVRKVLTDGGRAVGIELVSGERKSCECVISTMPLTTLVLQLEGAPAEVVQACLQLKFRNTVLVYLEILNSNPFPDNWVYVHSPDIGFGRVTNFRNWVPQLCGESPHAILALEYWCNEQDELWQRNDGQMGDLARAEIVKSGLVSEFDKIGRSFVVRIPKAYPVYRRGYQKHLRVVREYLNTISGLQVIGRYGSFKYNNQDHSILMGRLAAENILYGKSHDLWEVNTDYQTYQEACTITETGLATSPRLDGLSA